MAQEVLSADDLDSNKEWQCYNSRKSFPPPSTLNPRSSPVVICIIVMMDVINSMFSSHCPIIIAPQMVFFNARETGEWWSHTAISGPQLELWHLMILVSVTLWPSSEMGPGSGLRKPSLAGRRRSSAPFVPGSHRLQRSAISEKQSQPGSASQEWHWLIHFLLLL